LRKRGWGAGRWFGRGGGGGRGLDKLRDLRGLGLREVRELENLDELPEDLSAGAARWEGNRPVALLASPRDGLDLLGWARVAARRAGGDRGLREVLIAAPSFSARTRQAAARAAECGPSVHLVALPALAAEGREVYELESHPAAPKPSLIGGSAGLLGRVLRVLEGAAALSGAAGIRPAGSDYLLYVRGERAARISAAGDEVALSIALPERRELRVHEHDFASLAAELHEQIVRLARDERLADGAAARRDALVERCAEEAHAGVTARWLPWNDEGRDPIEWVGIDIAGRPVVGAIRSVLGIADVPALVAGWHRLDLERETWTPGAVGLPRIFVSADEVDADARELLESLAGPIGAGALPVQPLGERESDSVADADAADDAGERDELDSFSSAARSERRGRRRGRRRRRGGERGYEDQAPIDEAAAQEEREARRAARRAEQERGRFESESEPEPRSDDDAREPEDGELERASDAPAAAANGEPPRRSRGRRGRRRRGGRRGESGASAANGEGGENGGEGDAAFEAAEQGDGDFGDAEEPRADGAGGLAAAAGDDEQLSSELEATLAESEEEPERGGPAAEPVEVSPPRMRRQRAAILVRDDPDSILAALVLARDRRTIVSFRVAPQEGLMDFFKGPATDIADNVDVLVVGFSAQPRPKEVLDTVELFRGRLQWFDHHEWAIEDLVRLRAALGRDSIVIEEDASSPLGAVTEVTERRSRFTDKLVDLSARRLSESDMQKWGNRVVALIKRMAQSPGEHRPEILPVLSGKPTDLPSAPDVYQEETAWVEENDPRIVHFGEYQLAVARVPAHLDAGEVGRRLRLRTGARLSLATREGDDIVMLSCNDEKRPLNVSGLLDAVGHHQPWVLPKSGGDRIGRARLEGLPEHPERMEALIGEIVRHRSVLYG